MERSRKLERQFKRYLGKEDAEAQISSFSVQLKNDGKDLEIASILTNFSTFLDAIDKSYTEYEDRIKIATRNIEISSNELTEAYKKLEHLNANINTMLDSIGQAFLFFDQTGICSPIHSKACLSILGADPSGRPLPNLLRFNEKQEKTFNSWLKIVFAGQSALDFDDMKKLLPDEIRTDDGHIIEIDYKPMHVVDDQLMGVLLIASDVTEKRRSDEKLRKTIILAHKIQYAAQNRNGFHSLITDISAFVDSIRTIFAETMTRDDMETILRDIHTYKGLSSMFNMTDITTVLNKIESALSGVSATQFSTILKQEILALDPLIELEKRFAESIFGPDFLDAGEVRVIETRKIYELREFFSTKSNSCQNYDEICRFINKNILSTPIFDAFFPFERELQRIAAQQGKPPVSFSIIGENLPILLSEYKPFFRTLVHIARNIIDHGIEPPSIRQNAGKAPHGHIEINIALNQKNTMTLTIRDDGAGIDAGQIREMLLQKNKIDLSKASDKETLTYIFKPEFTTRSKASIVSGRGMGMSSVQEAINAMGGTITVESCTHKKTGTTFTITLPYR